MKDSLGIRIANFQFALSVIIIGVSFTLLVMQGLHKLDASVADKAIEMAMLVSMYWFQRQRHVEQAVPIQPVNPAPGEVK